ncbi:putative cation-transporting ATPase V [Parachlamydia acanthamoebae UV-7]|jgi:Cu2+-exporting ATPase|uniref:Putative cation-transporting ATPase V n=2 Tax=Parachlamydia acanthamoebae TaxID=83552 RepID=F8KYE3_PARAV|nr:heavy metal translocating P-type ATPase [Parachlamydia acanthamoebae]EFB42732.1 hypothetical protein pah_c003o011 [Parachlamydia acanthamoebae str. Hall's coccus]CCB85882.1 putative cation-transporting ATPase V [Parachlamydia acanthamoebae UV-7]
MTSTSTQTHCDLCATPLAHSVIQHAEGSFCCLGCQAVFSILRAQNQLADWKSHPLFHQAVKSGLISNPELMHQIDQKEESSSFEWKRYYIEISNMWCISCAEVIRWILLKEKGIRKCQVDYSTDLVVLEFAPCLISKEKIHQILGTIGYHVQALENTEKKAVSLDLYIRFAIAAFFSLNIMMFSYPIYAAYFDQDDQGWGLLFAWFSFCASLPVVFYSGWPIFRRFWLGMKAKVWGMEALIVIGVLTSFGMSLYELMRGSFFVYFDSMTAIITFVLLGKIIENKAKYSAKESLLGLVRSLPKRARKREVDGSCRFVPIKEIREGDLIQILSGEKIVLDGIVRQGEGVCDESLITGESALIRKKNGDAVIGGTFLQQGTCVVEVTATLDQTIFHQIIESVQQDVQHKTLYKRSVDQIVKWFIPTVSVIATAAAITCYSVEKPLEGQSSLNLAAIRFISILLISCPCAIGIAAPLAESYLMQGLAQLGILVRNRAVLHWLGRETLYVFDKTGTITEGKFKIVDGLSGLSEHHSAILKTLANHSLHPISCAIAQCIQVPSLELNHIEELSGKGIWGKYQELSYFLGSKKFLMEQGVIHFQGLDLNEHAHSEVYFAEGYTCLIRILLGDSVKEQAAEAIHALAPMKTLLLSGDRTSTVSRVASLCGFHSFKSEITPLEKKHTITSLRDKGEIVVMVGDGINDAPALANAHVGISVANAADISMQASDVLLVTDSLHVLPKMRKLSKKGRRILTQNLFWAFFYNIVGIFLATFGYLNPIFAAFAMTASSLIVLFNAQRLRRE